MHTPEPWKVLKDSEMAPADVWIVPSTYQDHTDHAIAEMSAAYDCLSDAARIVAAVNGCAGLNPAAYRQVVEALKACLPLVKNHYRECKERGRMQPYEETCGYQAEQALTHAQEQP